MGGTEEGEAEGGGFCRAGVRRESRVEGSDSAVRPDASFPLFLPPFRASQSHRPTESLTDNRSYLAFFPLSQPIPPPLTSRRTYLGLAMHLDSLFSLIAPPLPPATTPDPHRKHFSPWYYVDATFPPTFLSWGDQDTLVRPRQSIIFRDKLEELGVECGWAIAKGASHGYAEKVSLKLRVTGSRGSRQEARTRRLTFSLSLVSPGLRREQAWSHLVGGSDSSWTRVCRQQARREAWSFKGDRRVGREVDVVKRICRGRGGRDRDKGRSLGFVRFGFFIALQSLLVS